MSVRITEQQKLQSDEVCFIVQTLAENAYKLILLIFKALKSQFI